MEIGPNVSGQVSIEDFLEFCRQCPRIFCPLLGTVRYWELLLNKNGREAEFCPLLGAFPLLGSALLGALSVLMQKMQNYSAISGLKVGISFFNISKHVVLVAQSTVIIAVRILQFETGTVTLSKIA